MATLNESISKQLILGHRGSPREQTENTLLSLARAVQVGADGVELDVQRSRDAIPVVIHDDSLDRTTNGRGVVSSLEWPAIERLTNGSVPSFQQAAAWAAASGAWLNVELKASGVERAVVELLEEMDLVERTFISSFDPSIVRKVRDFSGSVSRFLLTDCWDAAAIERVGQADAEGVSLRWDAATDGVVEELHERGLRVALWTVNQPEQIRHFLGLGVAAIISDYPEMAARERARLNQSHAHGSEPGLS